MPEPERPSERINDGFLSRWSERKLALRDGATVDDESPTEDASGQRDSGASDDTPSRTETAAALTDADMPPLEELDADSDFSGFLSQGVSDSLRNQALKKLFFSGPFNVVDGLDDYAEDFTQFAALGNIVTAEMRHRIEAAAKRIAADNEAAADMETQAAGADGATETGPGDNALETAPTDAEGQEER